MAISAVSRFLRTACESFGDMEGKTTKWNDIVQSEALMYIKVGL